MHIDQFRHNDIASFLELAAGEGWICDPWELTFLLKAFPHGCFVAREGNDAAAFITAIKYDRSGWIGNLIVRADLRGDGIGTSLMKLALGALLQAGTETIWLTASTEGKPIYERLGFTKLDWIRRWVGEGVGEAAYVTRVCPEEIHALDLAGWGDRRDQLIDTLLANSRVVANRQGFIVLQQSGEAVQLGPWGYIGTEGSAELLDGALARIGRAVRTFLDVPVSNVAAASLLLARGFLVKGSSELMYLGERPAYCPEKIYALASMGSMG